MKTSASSSTPKTWQTAYPVEAANDPWVWTALAWGSRRDLLFLNSLRREQNLKELEKDNNIVTREGIIRGDRSQSEKKILDRRSLRRATCRNRPFCIWMPRPASKSDPECTFA